MDWDREDNIALPFLSALRYMHARMSAFYGSNFQPYLSLCFFLFFFNLAKIKYHHCERDSPQKHSLLLPREEEEGRRIRTAKIKKLIKQEKVSYYLWLYFILMSLEFHLFRFYPNKVLLVSAMYQHLI